MSPIKLTVADNVVSINIDGGVCSPEDLRSVEVPSVDFTKPVVLDGRAPTWVFSFLTHEFHPAIAVAVNAPREGGAIVVATHSKEWQVGDIIEV